MTTASRSCFLSLSVSASFHALHGFSPLSSSKAVSVSPPFHFSLPHKSGGFVRPAHNLAHFVDAGRFEKAVYPTHTAGSRRRVAPDAFADADAGGRRIGGSSSVDYWSAVDKLEFGAAA